MHCQCVGTTIPDLGDAVTIDDFDQASAAVLRRNEILLRITINGRPGSFRIPLRSQPGDLARAVKPLISFGLACEAINVPNVSSGIMGFNLPITIGDALDGKGDARRFAHR